MTPLLAAVLVLHPVVAEAGDLRMAATGVGPSDVTWAVDGDVVAVTADRQAASVFVEAGPHRVTAESGSATPWTAVVRPAPPASGLEYVPAWSASSPGEPPQPIPWADWLPAAALAIALLVRRHSKGP